MDETADMRESLHAHYGEMAQDEVRESEAPEWTEATSSDARSAVTLPPEESLRRLRKTLDSLEQSLGPDHPDTLHARRRLAHRHRADGDFSQALLLFQANVAGWSRVLGRDSAETLRARSSLANCHYAAGQYEEAIRQFSDVLRDRERVLGPDHPDTLRSRGSLANSHRAAGRLLEAAGSHRALLQDRARALGPDHPSTEATRKNLAAAEAELGGGVRQTGNPESTEVL